MSHSEDKSLGTIIAGIMIVLALAMIIGFLSSCDNRRDYEFRYVVEVKYTDNTSETLSGTTKVLCKDPEDIQFTISERFRRRPCLVLSEGDVTFDELNIACDIKSFHTHTLDWRELKD